MSELSDRDLHRIRLLLIDVTKSFFIEEPDSEKMGRWRGIFTALLKERVNPFLDNAVKELYAQVNSKKLKELQEEYYQLFVDPYDRDRIQLDASYHIDGRSYGVTLAEFRGYLQERDLMKYAPYKESEDSLVVMLDVLGTLIEEEKKGNELARTSQAALLEKFLEPLVKKLSGVFCENSTADFYASCIKFLHGYLDLEKGLIGAE